MKQWWQSLQSRERQFLTIGSLLLLATLLWAFVWLPWQQQSRLLDDRIQARSQQLLEMQEIAARVKWLGEQASPAAREDRRSLLRLADETARAAGLAAALKRIEPEQDGQVRIWLENAPFDKLIGWLEEIDRQYGARVVDASIDRGGSGVVSARLLIESRGQPR